MDFSNIIPEPSSYKDADGSVFYANGKVYRSIDASFQNQYTSLKTNNFYEKAITNGFLTPFQEIKIENKIYLESEKISVISYPYEWGFEQLKTAAIFHLDFLSFCLENNCILKDASPYNIQFVDGKPIFIDILSITPYEENTHWKAYRQFCEFFLSPLLLSHYFVGNWNRNLLIDMEGIPLQKTSSLLPFMALSNSLASVHIIAQSKVKSSKTTTDKIIFPKSKITSIINHLRVGIEELKPKENKSNWSNYVNELPYSKQEIELKQKTIHTWLLGKLFNILLDVGANNTMFVQGLTDQAKQVVLIDNDMSVIDTIYKETKNKHILPLQIDITNVSPAIGINLTERKSFFERVRPDITMALAVIHHLFHSRNIPLPKIAELFNLCSPLLIIEFIHETDEMFLKIRNPENKHPYNKDVFETAFKEYFTITKTLEIKAEKRTLYLMQNKHSNE